MNIYEDYGKKTIYLLAGYFLDFVKMPIHVRGELRDIGIISIKEFDPV